MLILFCARARVEKAPIYLQRPTSVFQEFIKILETLSLFDRSASRNEGTMFIIESQGENW